MHDGVENEIAQHQPVGSRQAIHREIRIAGEVEHQLPLPQFRPQPDKSLLGELADLEMPSFKAVAVGSHLLE